MTVRLHHIGLVGEKISALADVFRALGLEAMADPEPDPIQKVAASFVSAEQGNAVYIELLEPTEETSPISPFLRRRGAGLHHLCFEVDDIETKSKDLVGKGFKMVCPPVDCLGYDRSFRRVCAHPTQVAFFMHPNKILIELLEKGVG